MERSEEFREWLKLRYSMSPTTLSNYFYVIRKLLKQYDEAKLTVDDLNRFLTAQGRILNSVIVMRSAIVKYCEWTGKKAWIADLKKMRSKGHKNPPSEVTYAEIKRLFGCFKDRASGDVFTIQALSGCRQVEAWLIERRTVQYKETHALAMIRQKGGRSDALVINDVQAARTVFGREEYKGRKYPFLPEYMQDLTREEILEKHYAGIRKRYARAWEQACTKAGLPQYRSHDARRALGRAVYSQFGIYAAKKVLRHKKLETTAGYIEGLKVDVAEVLREVAK